MQICHSHSPQNNLCWSGRVPSLLTSLLWLASVRNPFKKEIHVPTQHHWSSCSWVVVCTVSPKTETETSSEIPAMSRIWCVRGWYFPGWDGFTSNTETWTLIKYKHYMSEWAWILMPFVFFQDDDRKQGKMQQIETNLRQLSDWNILHIHIFCAINYFNQLQQVKTKQNETKQGYFLYSHMLLLLSLLFTETR